MNENDWRIRAIEQRLERVEREKASVEGVSALRGDLAEVRDSIRWGSRTLALVVLGVAVDIILRIAGVTG